LAFVFDFALFAVAATFFYTTLVFSILGATFLIFFDLLDFFALESFPLDLDTARIDYFP
jgi:hypothetical protein